jgi:hypothetical protein
VSLYALYAAVAGGLIVAGATLIWRVAGDMASDEIRGWLDIAPRAILRLAGARLNREQREMLYHEEWLPELQFIMKEAEGRPITRAIKAFGFALGLLLAARVVSRLRPPTPPAVADDAQRVVTGPDLSLAESPFPRPKGPRPSPQNLPRRPGAPPNRSGTPWDPSGSLQGLEYWRATAPKPSTPAEEPLPTWDE